MEMTRTRVTYYNLLKHKVRSISCSTSVKYLNNLIIRKVSDKLEYN